MKTLAKYHVCNHFTIGEKTYTYRAPHIQTQIMSDSPNIFCSNRKDFRPAYAKLGVLGNYFPQIPIVGLTATANCKTQGIICDSLGLFDPTIIKINPDRENIYFASYTRKSTGDAKLSEVLEPLVQQLKQERQQFPLTLVYSNLETISDCYMYFSEMLGTEQYEPPDAQPIAKNRMFTLFHAQYPNHEHQRIITELASGTSKLRILFVTVAFGIGVDIQNIRQVIHIGVPYTMEEYFQEAGRCGRDGLPSKALVYYNAYDISQSRTNMADVMREFVTANKCKREIILRHFGYETPRRSLPQHTCCDYHRETCDCDTCLLSDVSNLYLASPLEDTSEAEVSPVDNHEALSKSKAKKLRQDLIDYRLSLHGSGRSCVGGVTLATGFSIQLIDAIVKNAICLTSVERVMMDFPVFSTAHAKAIYNIVQKYR